MRQAQPLCTLDVQMLDHLESSRLVYVLYPWSCSLPHAVRNGLYPIKSFHAGRTSTDLLLASFIIIPSAQQIQHLSNRIALAGMTMSVVLNILLPGATIACLLYEHWILRAAVRNVIPNEGCRYISLARLLAVSAALYTAVYIVLIVQRHDIQALIVGPLLSASEPTAPCTAPC